MMDEKIKTISDLVNFICNAEGDELDEFLEEYGNFKIKLQKENKKSDIRG